MTMRGVAANRGEVGRPARSKIFVSAKNADENDPIKQEGFNIRRGRQPNPERIARIRFFAQRQREMDDRLAKEVREAIATGHSYRQVAEAAGVSVSVIQRMTKMARH